MPTMEALCEMYRGNRALMSYCYVTGKVSGIAKVIIIRGVKDYEGYAVYENGTTYIAWGNRKASLMTRMKREVKKTLDNG